MHTWKKYVGLIEIYHYCIECDKKKEVNDMSYQGPCKAGITTGPERDYTSNYNNVPQLSLEDWEDLYNG